MNQGSNKRTLGIIGREALRGRYESEAEAGIKSEKLTKATLIKLAAKLSANLQVLKIDHEATAAALEEAQKAARAVSRITGDQSKLVLVGELRKGIEASIRKQIAEALKPGKAAAGATGGRQKSKRYEPLKAWAERNAGGTDGPREQARRLMPKLTPDLASSSADPERVMREHLAAVAEDPTKSLIGKTASTAIRNR